MRPTSFDEIVGQQRVKDVVQVLTNSAKHREAAIPHILFSGPPGTGKTTFAKVTANESDRRIILANGGSITNSKDLLFYVESIEPQSILFVDEVHAIPRKVQEIMYTIMEDFSYERVEGGRPWSVKVPEFTLIGATTDIGLLNKPFRERFKFVAEFETYTLDELAEIVTLVAKTYKFTFDDKIARQIAKTCRGNPRHVVSRTEWVRDFMISNQTKKMSAAELAKAIEMQGFDSEGLRTIDRDYLNCLGYKPVSLRTLAKKLNVKDSTITEDVEPYLIQQGLIEVQSKGRVKCSSQNWEF